jgi:hypothetical protein
MSTAPSCVDGVPATSLSCFLASSGVERNESGHLALLCPVQPRRESRTGRHSPAPAILSARRNVSSVPLCSARVLAVLADVPQIQARCSGSRPRLTRPLVAGHHRYSLEVQHSSFSYVWKIAINSHGGEYFLVYRSTLAFNSSSASGVSCQPAPASGGTRVQRQVLRPFPVHAEAQPPLGICRAEQGAPRQPLAVRCPESFQTLAQRPGASRPTPAPNPTPAAKAPRRDAERLVREPLCPQLLAKMV